MRAIVVQAPELAEALDADARLEVSVCRSYRFVGYSTPQPSDAQKHLRTSIHASRTRFPPTNHPHAPVTLSSFLVTLLTYKKSVKLRYLRKVKTLG